MARSSQPRLRTHWRQRRKSIVRKLLKVSLSKARATCKPSCGPESHSSNRPTPWNSAWDASPRINIIPKKFRGEPMKVRMLAAISILSLAAWLPLQAQQSAAPADPAQKSQAPAASSTPDKASAKHDCCCTAKETTAQAATSDQQSKGCCHAKTAGEAKASCCDGKDAKDMSCCGKKADASTSAMSCCQAKKHEQCSAKGAKSCCNGKSAQSAKACCTGMADHCPAPASGK
jgi:hypothetical protein